MSKELVDLLKTYVNEELGGLSLIKIENITQLYQYFTH